MNDLKLIKRIVKSPDKGIQEAINIYGGKVKAVCVYFGDTEPSAREFRATLTV